MVADIVMSKGRRVRGLTVVIAGDRCHLHLIHRVVHYRSDAQHHPSDAGERRERCCPGQPSISHGRGSLYHVVYPRVCAEVQCFTK